MTHEEEEMTDTDKVLKDFGRSLKLAEIRTWKQYVATAREFLDYIEGRGIAYTAVNEGIATDYRAHLLEAEAGLSRFTINNNLNRLRKFYGYAYRKRLVYSNPFAAVHAVRTGISIPKNILNVGDMGKLLDSFGLMTHFDIMTKAVVELLYGSALRISEARELTLKDIDFEAGALHITDCKNGGVRMKRPATEASLRFLKRYIRDSREKLLTESDLAEGRLFPKKGCTSVLSVVNRKLVNESRRLGLKKITSHSFRHSAATHLLRAGAGIREVQEMLGHRNITSTEAYTRILKEDLKEAIGKFHPRENADVKPAGETRSKEDDEENRILQNPRDAG
jgi:site-specific recombinase XerD